MTDTRRAVLWGLLLGAIVAVLAACSPAGSSPAPIDASYRLTRDQATALHLAAGRAFRGEGQARAGRGLADALLWLQQQITEYVAETDRGPGPPFDVALTSQGRNAMLRVDYRIASGTRRQAEREMTRADAAALQTVLANGVR